MRYIEIVTEMSRQQVRTLINLDCFGYIQYQAQHGYINFYTKTGHSVAYQGVDWPCGTEKERVINRVFDYYIQLTEEIQAFSANTRKSYMLLDINQSFRKLQDEYELGNI